MRILLRVFRVVLMLAVLAGAGYVIYWVGDQFFTVLLELDRQVAVAFLGTVGTIGGVVWSQWRIKKREIEAAQRPEKIKVYDDFMENLIVKTLKRTDEAEITEEWVRGELQEFFYRWTGDIIVWGSPGFVRAYQRFRHLGQQDKADPNVLLTLDKMMQEIRKDLGHSDWTLSDGDLISLYLTDPENLPTLTGGE